MHFNQQSTSNAQGTRVQQGSVDRSAALFQTSSREPAQHPRPVYKRWSPSGELLCAAMFAQCWTMDPVLDPERDNADPAWPVLARPEQSFYGVSDHNKGARRHCFNILPWWLLNQYKMRRLTERKKMNKKLRQKLNKVLSWFWERQNHTRTGMVTKLLEIKKYIFSKSMIWEIWEKYNVDLGCPNMVAVAQFGGQTVRHLISQQWTAIAVPILCPHDNTYTKLIWYKYK